MLTDTTLKNLKPKDGALQGDGQGRHVCHGLDGGYRHVPL